MSNKIICMIAAGNHQKLLEYSLPSIKRYASKYDFRIKIQTGPPKSGEPHFEKINLILDLLERYEYVFCLDCDLKFMRFDKNIMDYTINDDSWLYISREPKGWLNTGVMLIRSCEESKEFFRKIVDLKDGIYDDPAWTWARGIWHDQACLLKLVGCIVDPKTHTAKYIRNQYHNYITIIHPEWNRIMDYENGKNAIIRHYAGGYSIDDKILFLKYNIIGRNHNLGDKFIPCGEEQRWEQILFNIPEINNNKTILYVGARENRFQFEKKLLALGYDITVLEIFPANVKHLRSIGKKVIEDDIRNFKTNKKWDIVMWWHGPEHIEKSELPIAIENMENAANNLVIMGCPYGICEQGKLYGNEFEIHRSALYIEDFLKMGYNAESIGTKDIGGSNILSWKYLR